MRGRQDRGDAVGSRESVVRCAARDPGAHRLHLLGEDRQRTVLSGLNNDKLHPGTAHRALIRVEADELTYSLHVILRFELEQEMLAGTVKLEELPEAWNARMQSYLGVTVPNDALGVLQDVHWSGGSFGYFPSYTLGALYAAQFYRQARIDVAGLEDALAAGDVAPLVGWLRAKIHQPCSRWSTDDLARRATSETLNPQYFIDYAREKYARLYRLA